MSVAHPSVKSTPSPPRLLACGVPLERAAEWFPSPVAAYDFYDGLLSRLPDWQSVEDPDAREAYRLQIVEIEREQAEVVRALHRDMMASTVPQDGDLVGAMLRSGWRRVRIGTGTPLRSLVDDLLDVRCCRCKAPVDFPRALKRGGSVRIVLRCSGLSCGHELYAEVVP